MAFFTGETAKIAESHRVRTDDEIMEEVSEQMLDIEYKMSAVTENLYRDMYYGLRYEDEDIVREAFDASKLSIAMLFNNGTALFNMLKSRYYNLLINETEIYNKLVYRKRNTPVIDGIIGKSIKVKVFNINSDVPHTDELKDRIISASESFGDTKKISEIKLKKYVESYVFTGQSNSSSSDINKAKSMSRGQTVKITENMINEICSKKKTFADEIFAIDKSFAKIDVLMRMMEMSFKQMSPLTIKANTEEDKIGNNRFIAYYDYCAYVFRELYNAMVIRVRTVHEHITQNIQIIQFIIGDIPEFTVEGDDENDEWNKLYSSM